MSVAFDGRLTSFFNSSSPQRSKWNGAKRAYYGLVTMLALLLFRLFSLILKIRLWSQFELLTRAQPSNQRADTLVIFLSLIKCVGMFWSNIIPRGGSKSLVFRWVYWLQLIEFVAYCSILPFIQCHVKCQNLLQSRTTYKCSSVVNIVFDNFVDLRSIFS